MKSKRDIHVRKRSDGLFELRYTENGVQRSIYGKNKGECRLRYGLIRNSAKRTAEHSMTFLAWYEKWLSLYKVDNLKERTLNNLKGIFNKHILPYIGTKSLRRINSQDLQEVFNNMRNIPRQATIAYIQVNACFEQAYRLNIISHNPCLAVVIKKDKGGKGRALTFDEERTLVEYLEKTNDPFREYVYLYLSLGVRRSELLNIDGVDDVDRENNVVHIRGTKTEGSDRCIQTLPEIIALIPLKHKAFSLSADKVNRKFKELCDLLGFEGITLHSLRHTFATRCIENGISEIVVQKWLGHASITMTLDRYTHISEEFKSQEIDKLSFSFLP
ncbi:MAG: tyrosine-type recombinase/integrase [Christensenellales bacterium]